MIYSRRKRLAGATWHAACKEQAKCLRHSGPVGLQMLYKGNNIMLNKIEERTETLNLAHFGSFHQLPA
jgi:hypothetical protein